MGSETASEAERRRGAGMIDGVFFDFTHTLAEPADEVGALYARVSRDFGVDLPAWRLTDAFVRVMSRAPSRFFADSSPDEVARLERQWWREIVRQTYQATDGTARFEDFDTFFEQLFLLFAGSASWRLREGASQALEMLRERGLRTGVISNFDHRLPAVLKSLEIASLLDTVMFPQRCGAAKPAPAIFHAALRAGNVEPHRAVYVGHDIERDLSAARAAGLRAIDVSELTSIVELVPHLGLE